ncbi:microviridin/marinostatin family tricyclic proteinase inhibitor [Cystobacter fuscus]|uniref:microviridin/marinostatin family tricyclic proteinase inhibitor n=1 Tax=Cystobacter fuscus TaxID=43 RepID=UPI002B2938B3|nr:microviridin/marinostatin family tricyclic proteinase inhibitor [Cystobacter fuscus]
MKQETKQKPFFARLLEAQGTEPSENGQHATRKYPSDNDEDQTLKYPSDGEDLGGA